MPLDIKIINAIDISAAQFMPGWLNSGLTGWQILCHQCNENCPHCDHLCDKVCHDTCHHECPRDHHEDYDDGHLCMRMMMVVSPMYKNTAAEYNK